MPVVANYMDGYKVRPTMRTILVDWMIGVHGRFKLLQETLYMTVAVMDRYLQVCRGKLPSSNAKGAHCFVFLDAGGSFSDPP